MSDTKRERAGTGRYEIKSYRSNNASSFGTIQWFKVVDPSGLVVRGTIRDYNIARDLAAELNNALEAK